MSITGNTFTVIDDIDSEGIATGSIGADARTERIIEPHQSGAVYADA